MDIKKEILLKSIQKTEAMLNKTIAIIEAKPIQDIIAARKEAGELLNKYAGNFTDAKFLKRLDELSKIEKKAFKLSKRRKNYPALLNKRHKLSEKLSIYKNELYRLELNEKKTKHVNGI